MRSSDSDPRADKFFSKPGQVRDSFIVEDFVVTLLRLSSLQSKRQPSEIESPIYS